MFISLVGLVNVCAKFQLPSLSKSCLKLPGGKTHTYRYTEIMTLFAGVVEISQKHCFHIDVLVFLLTETIPWWILIERCM